MKISLLGQFGSGNSGNDGSLEAMLIYLRRQRPDAEFVCICFNPTVVETRYNIRAVNAGGPPLSSSWAIILNRALLKLPRRLGLIVTALIQLNGFDVMIIPGTGILDDFQEKAFGWPFVIFCWCLFARICRTKVAFVSIGAGPIKGWLSRWFLRSAAKMASYRSYRDNYSMEFMRMIGIDVSKDRRYPDIAFSLPVPSAISGPLPHESLCVGVGVMNYQGWRTDNPHAVAIYENYIRKISTLIGWLLAQGYRVSLLTGDVGDLRACNDVMQQLEGMIGKDEIARIETGAGASLHEIMEQMARVDLAIVSRYHNLVCAMKLNRPTISLGYARKNDDLMGDFQQARYCEHIQTFEVDRLTATFSDLLANRESIERQIRLVNERWQQQLFEQQQLLNQQLFLTSSNQQGETPQISGSAL